MRTGEGTCCLRAMKFFLLLQSGQEFVASLPDVSGSQRKDQVARLYRGQDSLRRRLNRATILRSAVAELPCTTASPDATVAHLLVETGLTSSLSESRRAIDQGGVSLNNIRVEDPSATIDGAFLPGGIAVLRRGKKTLAGVLAG